MSIKLFKKLFKTVRAVLWSFLGIRKSASFQDDIAALTPFHIIIVGFILCFVFVIGLMIFAQWMANA